ncbi:sensor domain-containing diguanylate cyclase [Thioalkalivibrio sp. ALJ16]|uniref:sensor domain-containing diguanylate cyclase n=1 Tax=Thioalkalivibrio sp. ALJ16 TaxID=1158762 RepID=UPI00036B8EA1|nr:sensor domain-containing diguanylate cyclase [Thioalkalivibrio sp. ALJ16]
MPPISFIEGFEKLRLLDAAIEQSHNSVVITDADLDAGPRIIYVNAGFERMTGYTREEALGQTPRMLQGPATSRAVLDRMRGALACGECFDGEAINYRKDGSWYYVRWHISPVHSQEDERRVTHFVSVQQDISEDRRRDDQLRLLSTALEVSADPVLITDPEGTITYVNAAFEDQTGYSRNEAQGQNPRILKSGQQDAAFYQELWATLKRGEAFRGEFVNRRRDGSLMHMEQSISPVTNAEGEVTHYVSIGKDVTDRVRMEEEIRRLAHTDWLTGLANRLSLGNTLESEMERSRRYGRPLSLIMFDIDHFKDFNDDYGHETGDEVLKRLAVTVREGLREADSLGRWGGEEFLVVVPETSGSGAEAMAEKLRKAVAAMETSCPISVTASFGVTEMRPGDTPKSLTRRVDEAMYQAKEAGRNRVVLL